MAEDEVIDNIEKENIEADAPVEPEPVDDPEPIEEEPAVEDNEEVLKEANETVMEEVKEFHEKVEAQKKEKEEVKEVPKEKSKKTFDLAKLNTFKEKLIAEFGLEEKTNKRKRTALKLNGKAVIRFIPRKRVWYAVKHYDESMKRIMYYTVESKEQEQEHYEFVKVQVAKLQESPKEA